MSILPQAWQTLPALFMMMALLSGCITKATTDATTEFTKAPFDATTDVTRGSTDATTEFTEPTKELTSPGTWSNDGIITQEHRARTFAANHLETLIQDIAKGQGEYLVSFATLLGVPVERQAEFSRLAQSYCPMVCFEGGPPRDRADTLIRKLTALSLPLE